MELLALVGVLLGAGAGYVAKTFRVKQTVGQAEDKAKARSAGFDVHLTKPADPERLLRQVSAAG